MRTNYSSNDPCAPETRVDESLVVERLFDREGFFDLLKDRVLEVGSSSGMSDQDFLEALDDMILRIIDTEKEVL